MIYENFEQLLSLFLLNILPFQLLWMCNDCNEGLTFTLIFTLNNLFWKGIETLERKNKVLYVGGALARISVDVGIQPWVLGIRVWWYLHSGSISLWFLASYV